MNRLVRNEQAKLSATYLNGVAIALMAVGVFAPLASLAISGTETGLPQLVAVVLGCVLGSASLHYTARKMLRGLQE